jgi:tetratricopeptide (TPR) repeat protein
MASVFLSYDHDDVARAAPIAAALEKAGHSVWWDRHIHGGAEYNNAIESAVETADVVVVLWSTRAVQSAWVRDEAAEGRDRGKLVPVALDGTKPPMGFRQYQTITLPEWKGRKPPKEMTQLEQAIDVLAGPQSNRRATAIAEPPKLAGSFKIGWAAAIALLLALTAIGLFFWRAWQPENAATVAISAGDHSSASENYARDLLAQLGQLQSAKPGALRLVGPEDRKRAGMVFEVTGTTEGQQARTNLVLLDGRTGDLMWSSAFERPVSRIGDLRQQLGYTAATVLECAVEAHQGGRDALRRDVLKQYLNACARFSTGQGQTLSDLVPLFRRVIAAAPHFEGAWAKLLRSETNAYVAGNVGLRPEIERDIAAAQRVHPDMPATLLAQFDLLPDNAFGQRLSLIDRAIAADPGNADAVAFRSEALFAVGRVRESLDDARRAVQIDPISPDIRRNYIFSLAQTGRTEGALDEIAKAERIWPGSDAVDDAKFAFHLRFGDPRVAWQMIQTGEVPAAWIDARSFIQARITRDPKDIDLATKDAKAAYATDPSSFQHLVQTFTILDREHDLLPILMTAPLKDAIFVTDVTFRPAARELWRNPEALRYAQRIGLLSYWQASGKWPDFCFETDLPYDCKKEAAKLGS